MDPTPVLRSCRSIRIRACLAAAFLATMSLTPAARAQEAVEPEGTLRRADATMARALREAAARPGTAGRQRSAAMQGVAAVGDTTWIGYRAGQTNNYWKIGVGPNRPGLSTDGYWDFDHPVNGDSLMGWWPIRRPHTNSSGAVRTDENRVWWAAEFGNQANYVINQGRFDVTKLGTAWPGNRTFGVVGVWHSDPGNTTPGSGVNWSPLAGARSAWMGLRRHGDLTAMDPVTGNAFNADVLAFNAVTSTRTYPGYGAQMDQMLYRDVSLAGAPADSGVRITFWFRTQMSTLKSTATATRTGWYEGDPLTVNTVTPGNFISAEAGVPANSLAPVDSFQVYVGAPVEGTWVGSDNQTRPIYDPLRRWFNEVLQKDTRYWKFSRAGADSGLITIVITKAQKDAIIAAAGSPALRLVFRVHTNAGSSDDSGYLTYTSNGHGAAQVDDVRVNAGAGELSVGDFEGTDPAKDIDNLQPASVAWRSTGKPPATRFHAHDVSTLYWADLCGLPGSPNSTCNLKGTVIAMGDHDLGEATAGVEGTPERAGNFVVMSPTICLKTSGPSTPNAWDITGDMASASDDYYFYQELYSGIFNVFTQGNSWYFLCQSFPVLQADGTPTWSEIRRPSINFYDPDARCYGWVDRLKAHGVVLTSNASGIPDSIRIGWQMDVQCYRFGITTGCGPATGGYLDNLAFGMADAPLPAFQVDVWDWFNDTFPATDVAGLAGTAAFDTTSALVKTGFNITEYVGSTDRYAVPGDSALVVARGPDVRVDLVFRIKPGPGNHVTVGSPSSGVRQVPTALTPATPGDGSWWGTWMAMPGDLATPGAVALHAGWPGGWNPNAWMSARCDTAQWNLFPRGSFGPGSGGYGPAPDTSLWMSTYHESDPHLAVLGIPRRECFLIDTTGPPYANVTCTSVPAWVTANPTHTGYDGDPLTVEGTKILPDGLLTPGSHVQYFFRRSLASNPSVLTAMCPDTGTVVPQEGEGSLDGHRWQQFGVLPDRWKDPAFGGNGMACALVIDLADRRGDELAWVAMADSGGYTAASRRGAHNGWSAASGADPNDPAGFVAAHGGQPGTTWDLFGVKGGEGYRIPAGTIGSRLAPQPSVGDALYGKVSRIGPSLEMLAAYYKEIVLLTGDLTNGLLGPYADQSADDIGLLTGHLQGGTLAAPRGIAVFGDGFAASLATDPFLTDALGALDYGYSYSVLFGSYTPMLDLFTTASFDPGSPVFGIRDDCRYGAGMLYPNAAIAEATALGYFGTGTPGAYAGAILKPATALRPWVAATHSFRLPRLVTHGGYSTLQRAQYANLLGNGVFGALCAVGPVTGVPDGPGSDRVLADRLRLLNTPLAREDAVLEFTLAAPDRVEIGLYDVSGRLVRTLAERAFPAGAQRLAWDGTDDDGHRLARGVYFARVRYAARGFESTKKVVVLR